MYSNYCRHSLLCTKYFVCACYELLMSINIVQCSTQTEKKGQQTLHKNPQSFSAFFKSVFKHTQPATSSCQEMI